MGFVLRCVFVSMLYSSCYYCGVDLSTFYLGFSVFHFLVNSIMEQLLDSTYKKDVIDEGSLAGESPDLQGTENLQ